MTRFDKTYEWLKPIFERLIKCQEESGIIVDGMNIIGKLGIDEKEEMIYEISGPARLIYYCRGWTDDEMETKKYWREKLSRWKIAHVEDLKGVDLT